MHKPLNNKNKPGLHLWMKIVLLLFCVIMVLSLYALITANIVNETSKQNRALPDVPFTTTLSFCALSQEAGHANLKKGSILLVQKDAELVVGDKVLFQNKFANKKEFAIEHSYLIGIISAVNQNGYTAKVMGDDAQHLEVTNHEIAGKITFEILHMGFIYQNMLGIRGYVLFGAIPALVILLLFFIMRLICFEQQKETEYDEDEWSIEEKEPIQNDILNGQGVAIAQEEIPLEIQPRTNDMKQKKISDETLMRCMQSLQRDDSSRQVKPIAEEINQNQQLVNQDEGMVEDVAVDRAIESTEKSELQQSSIIQPEIAVEREEIPLEVVQKPTFVNQSRFSNETLIKCMQKLQQSDSSHKIQNDADAKAMESAQTTDSQQDIIIQPKTAVAQEDAILEEQPKEEQAPIQQDYIEVPDRYLYKETQQQEKQEPVKLLSADEIIAQYRQNKKSDTIQKPDEYHEIAKMYYDDNIDNYES